MATDKASKVCIRSIPHKNSPRPAESPRSTDTAALPRDSLYSLSPGNTRDIPTKNWLRRGGKTNRLLYGNTVRYARWRKFVITISFCLRAGACGRGAPAGKRRAHLRQARGCNHVLLARWRLRAGSPRGLEASSPSASSRLQAHSVCALTLADCISTKSIVFLSFRTGPERTLGPGPLWTFPAPKEREERLPLLWKPPLPPQV